MTDASPAARWTSAWLDVLAFAVGLAAAWFGSWSATDLVWSLWLSSLVIGWSMIVWSILRPIVAIGRGAWRDRELVRATTAAHGAAQGVVVGSIALAGALFTLAFFTAHFGFFHFVHSQFLAGFFPLDGAPTGTMMSLESYAEVARRYWTFLPAAFLAERAAFAAREAPAKDDRSVTAEAIAARKAANAHRLTGMMAPYRNVMRMHFLIFFFAFTSFADLDTFAVFAVVYAVYFFPWRLVRRERSPGFGARGTAVG